MRLSFSLFTAIAALAFLAIPASAADYTLYGDSRVVTGGYLGNAVNLNSEFVSWSDFTYSSVRFDVPADFTFADLTALSTDFQAPQGGCSGGAPRFALKVDMNNNGTFEQPTDGNIVIYLGDAPNWTCTSFSTWINTGNLIGLANTDKRYDLGQVGGTFYDTYDNALALLGDKKILGISFAVDGSWALPGHLQTVLIDNVTINETIYTFDPALKTEVLIDRGVQGKGLENAPGLQKPFNPNSKAN